MPPPFIETHYSVFEKIPYEAQSVLGCISSCWANKFQLKDVPDFAALPVIQLDRRAVRAICRSPNYSVLFGYVCVMAWGLQLKKNAEAVWNNQESRNAIEEKLKKLRSGNLTRAQAYDLFRDKNKNAVKGLGPSYFTKLLYFFSPTPDFYIMDQWTGKSVRLLTGKRIVLMHKNKKASPTSENTGKNYRKFCEVVDSLAWQLRNTGEQMEERLFSKKCHPPAQWRAYVNKHYLH